MLLHPEVMEGGSAWFVMPAEERRVGLILLLLLFILQENKQKWCLWIWGEAPAYEVMKGALDLWCTTC